MKRKVGVNSELQRAIRTAGDAVLASAKRRRAGVVPVKIRSVSFRANLAIDKFQHIHIEATADVPKDHEPEQVIEELKDFVARELIRARDGAIEALEDKLDINAALRAAREKGSVTLEELMKSLGMKGSFRDQLHQDA